MELNFPLQRAPEVNEATMSVRNVTASLRPGVSLRPHPAQGVPGPVCGGR
jgi:hypothetical protein